MNTAKNLISTLQNQIHTRMEQKNLNARELERKAGLKISAVNNILTGKSNNPGIEALSAIARWLECSVDELIGNSDINTIKSKNKNKIAHEWNPELYKHCLDEVQNYIKSIKATTTGEQLLYFVKEAYLYSIEGNNNKADSRFIKWLIDSHY